MSLLRSIRVISFDAMNTVIKLKESPGETYAKFVSAQLKINIDAAVLNDEFRKAFCLMERAEPYYSFGHKNAEYWWQKVVRLSFQKVNKKIYSSI